MNVLFTTRIKIFLVAIAGMLLVACGNQEQATSDRIKDEQPKLHKLTVYKHLKCRCCRKWMNHLEDHNFTLDSKNLYDISDIKDEHNIPPNLRSCHTAISTDGYVFEGHIPAKYIDQFLLSPPENSHGLSVPAMPVGSPGMEVAERFQPYNIIQLNQDGSTQVYASISHYQPLSGAV